MEYRELNGVGHSKRVTVTKMTRTGARSSRLAQNILVLAAFFRYKLQVRYSSIRRRFQDTASAVLSPPVGWRYGDRHGRLSVLRTCSRNSF